MQEHLHQGSDQLNQQDNNKTREDTEHGHTMNWSWEESESTLPSVHPAQG
jgi:hypothetical protein